jgi:hypothetical protein
MLRQLKKSSIALMAPVALLAMSSLAKAEVRYVGNTVNQEVQHSGKTLQGRDLLEAHLHTTIDRVEERLVIDLQTVPSVECSTTPGEGKGDWKGYLRSGHRHQYSPDKG